MTPLLAACREGAARMAELLLAAGANPRLRLPQVGTYSVTVCETKP